VAEHLFGEKTDVFRLEGDTHTALLAGIGLLEPALAAAAAEDKQARWLEAIAYALLAIAGIGALGVLMLWSIVRELRRIGDRP
jgi:hypothetical protein